MLRDARVGAGVRRAGSTVVLMYHRVLPGGAPSDWPLKSLVVDAAAFEHQMKWLVERFELCTAHEAICGTAASERPRAAITFDDGYGDNFVHAAPVLRKFGARATFFVTSGFIGGRRRMWFEVAAMLWERAQPRPPLGEWMTRFKRMPVKSRNDELAALASPEDWVSTERDAPMTWDHVADLQREGHEIGCHSRTHPILTILSPNELRDEVGGGADDLRRNGVQPKGIAYPNGDCNPSVIASARDAGLTYGVTTRSGWHRDRSNVFEVNRVDVNPDLMRRWSGRCADGLGAELAWRSLRARFP